MTLLKPNTPRSKAIDYSGCLTKALAIIYTAYAEDSLNANRMNAKPGGQQPLMRDTEWNGSPQSLKMRVLERGHHKLIPKGLIQVLKERHQYRPKMKLKEMRQEIATHPDFANEKTKLLHLINQRGHTFQFIPKYHCELSIVGLNQNAMFVRTATTTYITGLWRNIPTGLEHTVSVENIRNYFSHIKDYTIMFGYLLGHKAAVELEKLVKTYSKQHKSHLRVLKANKRCT